MFKLGLTGSIASGKSTVLKAFGDLGYPVFSADQAVHQLYQNRAVGPLGALFPQAIVNGRIDRGALSAILAKKPELIKQLEAVVHPLVHEEIRDFLQCAQTSGARLAIVDIPLLFETGFDYGFDAVALTFCDEELLRARALARPGMDEKKLDFIVAHQLPQEKKKPRADYLINTGGSIEQMKDRVSQIASEILTKSN